MKSKKINYRILVPKSILTVSFLLGLQSSGSFAATSNPYPDNINSNICKTLNCPELKPTTPAEASFEEPVVTSATNSATIVLSPETPAEADFSDESPASTATVINLAPVTPGEADFNDSVPDILPGSRTLAPVTSVKTAVE